MEAAGVDPRRPDHYTLACRAPAPDHQLL